MSVEFECFECKCSTIFKDLEEIEPVHRRCANCDAPFSISKNLVRFDRSDEDKLGLLIPAEEAITHRLKALVEQLETLNDRMGRIEELILDDHETDPLDS